eukprot:jgi/Tetstr1/454030/TSEL_040949.t1
MSCYEDYVPVGSPVSLGDTKSSHEEFVDSFIAKTLSSAAPASPPSRRAPVGLTKTLSSAAPASPPSRRAPPAPVVWTKQRKEAPAGRPEKRSRAPAASPPVVTFNAFKPPDLACLSQYDHGKGRPVVVDRVKFASENHATKYFMFKFAAESARRQGNFPREYTLLTYAELFAGLDTRLTDQRSMKEASDALHLTGDEISEYRLRAVELQTKICMYKLLHYPDVEHALRSTGAAVLVNRVSGNSGNRTWGASVDRHGAVHGRNELGRIWMRLRNVMDWE